MKKRQMPLALWIFVGLIVGIAAGLILIPVELGGMTGLDIAKTYIKPFGTIFLNLLKFVVVPIVLFSIASGVISMQDVRKVGSVGGKTVVYYMCTTAFAVLLALILSTVARGAGLFKTLSTAGLTYEPPAGQSLMDTIVTIFPSNPITPLANATMLQVIVISLLLGFGILLAGEKGKVAGEVVESFNEVFLRIMDLIIKLSPIGVACLICPVVCENGPSILGDLFMVLLVAYIGYALHALLVYSVTVKALGGVSPGTFFRGMAPAMMMAFSSASSVGTLPFTLECSEKLGAQFLGALQGKGQSTHGGGGGKGHHHGGSHTPEESTGRHAAQCLHGNGVDQQGVECVTNVGHQQHHEQVAQNRGAVLTDHGADQTSHADGRELDNEVHDPQKDLVEALHHLTGHLALLPGQQDAEAQQQRDHNNLQHGGVGQRGNGVGGENGHDGVHQALSGGGLISQSGGGQGLEQTGSPGHGGQDQSQQHRESGGTHIIDHGFAAYAAHLAHILHGDDAGSDGEQHDGDHHELQQIQENGAEGFDVGFGNVQTGHTAQFHRDQDQTGRNAHDQTHEDPERQGHLSFFHKISSFFQSCFMQPYYTGNTSWWQVRIHSSFAPLRPIISQNMVI